MKFRSKVVEIDAWQFHDHDGLNDAPDWLRSALRRDAGEPKAGQVVPFPNPIDAQDLLAIGTLEGNMIAGPGDWIICGTEGELYPCKPSVFARKYEPA
jgi:hypothetical protein